MIVDLSNIKSGFCDKLKKLTLYIAFSNISKNNYLEIFDQKTKENPFLFSDICFIKNFKIKKLKTKKKEIFSFVNEYNSNPNLNNIRNITKKSDVVLNDNFLFEWEKSYALIRPKIKIKNIPSPSIGIHIRLTDKLVNMKKKLFEIPGKDVVLAEDYLKFKIHLKKLINQNSDKNFFLASDSENAKNEIIEIFKKNKKKIIINKLNFNKKSLRQTNGNGFIKDLFCLSNCDEIYSTGGGVPYTAKMIANKKIIYKKISFKKIFGIKLDLINILLYPLGKLYKKLFP